MAHESSSIKIFPPWLQRLGHARAHGPWFPQVGGIPCSSEAMAVQWPLE